MDNSSFNLEINIYQPFLHTLAIRYTKNTDDADDLVQDTLLKAMRYHHQFKEGTNIKGWLFTIMRNTFINGYRREHNKRSLISTEEEFSSQDLFISASNNQVTNKFVSDDIFLALKKLDPAFQVPFMRYFEGYKYHEIADALDIPIGTVKTRIHMARHILKKALKMYRNGTDLTVN